MTVFELENVTKKYSAKTVLNINRLSIESGSTTAILGPNGAGKSTLLRILNLLDDPNTGTLRFDGEPVGGLTVSARLNAMRQMSMVFQRSYMLHTSVYENIAYGLKLRRIPSRERRQRIMESLAFVGLSDFAERPANKLSGGEMQRVAMARALALRPRVLLLDEPTANLDPASVQTMESIIGDSRERFETTVVIVTHHIFQAKRLANRAVLLINGEVAADQASPKFFDQPENAVASGFLDGTMVY